MGALAARAPQAGQTGVLLLNLGTPASPEPRDVRRYLREFLCDPRVLDMPAPARRLLVEGVILPFRTRRSARAYRQIWSEHGSPLLVFGRALRDALEKQLGGWPVELGMRYGAPSIASALERLLASNVRQIAVAPLFPQYASASTGSALEALLGAAAQRTFVPALRILPPFYEQPGFIDALRAVSAPELAAFEPDWLLMSYHGLPEHQVRRSDPSGRHCLASDGCCAELVAANRDCYRAQCYATSRALASALGLSPERYGVAFQSRLGRRPWITPHTDRLLPELAARGVKRLAVVCPSFTADCLETLEEIGLRARDQWLELGGEALLRVPCVNAHPAWVTALAALVRE